MEARLFITFLWNDVKSEPSLPFSIIFNGFSRVFYIICFAWLMNECVNKRGGKLANLILQKYNFSMFAGIIEKLLSNKLLWPLSRLTYQIYLLNLLVVWFYFFTKRDLIFYRDIELVIESRK